MSDAHYDRVTPVWEQLIGDNFHLGYFASPSSSLSEAADALTHLLATCSDIRQDMEVLDVGCGVGGPAAFLAANFGCRVLGISTSQIGIERATKRASRKGLDGRLRFQIADAVATGLETNSFDRVWIMESAHLVPQKDLLLRESVRVLRPGGILCLCDIVCMSDIPITKVLKLRRELLTLQRVFGPVRTRHLAEYQHILERMGLKVELRDISNQVLPTLDRWKRNAELHAKAPTCLMSKNELQDFSAACDIMGRLWNEGTFGYGIILAEKPSQRTTSRLRPAC